MCRWRLDAHNSYPSASWVLQHLVVAKASSHPTSSSPPVVMLLLLWENQIAVRLSSCTTRLLLVQETLPSGPQPWLGSQQPLEFSIGHFSLPLSLTLLFCKLQFAILYCFHLPCLFCFFLSPFSPSTSTIYSNSMLDRSFLRIIHQSILNLVHFYVKSLHLYPLNILNLLIIFYSFLFFS